MTEEVRIARPGGPIDHEEWLRLVENDEELAPDPAYGAGVVRWRTAKGATGGWLRYRDGRVVSTNPDDALIAKMVVLAEALNAKAEGPDGETYRLEDDMLVVRAAAPAPARAPLASRRPTGVLPMLGGGLLFIGLLGALAAYHRPPQAPRHRGGWRPMPPISIDLRQTGQVDRLFSTRAPARIELRLALDRAVSRKTYSALIARSAGVRRDEDLPIGWKIDSPGPGESAFDPSADQGDRTDSILLGWLDSRGDHMYHLTVRVNRRMPSLQALHPRIVMRNVPLTSPSQPLTRSASYAAWHPLSD